MGGAALGRLFFLKHDGFGGDGWVKLTNDQQLKACATINGKQMERAWEGATFAMLGGAMVESREVLGRVKLAPGFPVGAQLWLPLTQALRVGMLAVLDRGSAGGAAGHPGVKHSVGLGVGLCSQARRRCRRGTLCPGTMTGSALKG